MTKTMLLNLGGVIECLVGIALFGVGLFLAPPQADSIQIVAALGCVTWGMAFFALGAMTIKAAGD